MMEGKTVGNLLGGVSQQADSQRFANAADESINAWPSPITGLRKRGAAQRVANILSGYPGVKTRTHIIERDGTEWYALVLADAGGVWTTRAWDVHPDSPNFGDEVFIYDDQGGLAANFLSTYLDGATVADEDMSVLTVGDTTFVANHSMAVAMGAAVSADQEEKAFVTVRAGAYGQQYGVKLDGDAYMINYKDVNSTWAIGYTPPGDDARQSRYIAPNKIADEIEQAIDGGAGPSISCEPWNWPSTLEKFRLRVWNASSGNFRLKVYYRVAGNTATSSYTTANLAWNAGVTAIVNALKVSPLNGVADWTVTESQSGGGLTSGMNIQFNHVTAGDSVLDIVVEDVSLGTVASVFDVEQAQNVLEVKRTDGGAFEANPLDSSRGKNVVVAKGEVTGMDKLPTTCRDGFKIAVQPDADSDDSEKYYVAFEGDSPSTSPFGEGIWKEALGFGVKTSIDPLTMPHVLVSKIDDGTGPTGLAGTPYFEVSPYTWDDRGAGDDDTNSAPSFFADGGSLTGMAYHRGRLALLSGSSVVFSEVGQPGNLFRTTVAGGLIDSDRIDLESQLPQAAAFRAGLELQEQLLLFSDISQVRLDSGNQLLTPQTAGLTVASNYRFDAGAQPVAAEYFGYFGFKRGGFSGVRQLWDASNGGAAMYRATDVTEQVSHYLVGDMEAMAVSTSVNALAVLTSDRSVIYLYRWEDSGNERIQSAWQKFTFQPEDKVASVDFAGSYLFVSIEHGDGVIDLEVIDLADGRVDDDGEYEVLLDRRVDESFADSITYDAPSDTTTVTMPVGYALREGEALAVVNRDANGIWQETVADADGQRVFDFAGDLTTASLFFGLRFRKQHRLSRVFLDGAATGRPTPEITGRTQVRRAVFDVEGTGAMEFHVTRRPGSPASIKRIDGYDPEAGITLKDGQYPIPVMAASDGYTLELINDSPFPSNVISLEYELTHQSRSQRRGR